MPFKFARLASTFSPLQVHAREDSKFVILPVMDPATVKSWVVYDVQSGQIVTPKPFASFREAKGWAEKELPQ